MARRDLNIHCCKPKRFIINCQTDDIHPFPEDSAKLFNKNAFFDKEYTHLCCCTAALEHSLDFVRVQLVWHNNFRPVVFFFNHGCGI